MSIVRYRWYKWLDNRYACTSINPVDSIYYAGRCQNEALTMQTAHHRLDCGPGIQSGIQSIWSRLGFVLNVDRIVVVDTRRWCVGCGSGCFYGCGGCTPYCTPYAIEGAVLWIQLWMIIRLEIRDRDTEYEVVERNKLQSFCWNWTKNKVAGGLNAVAGIHHNPTLYIQHTKYI